MLVAIERDSLKQLIESYQKDLTITNAGSEINPDVQLRMKLEMVEKSLIGYKELCAAQEKELNASKSLPDLGLNSTVCNVAVSQGTVTEFSNRKNYDLGKHRNNQP